MNALKHCHILVTTTSYGQDDPALLARLEEAAGRVTFNATGKPLSSAQLREMLPGVDGYIAGLDTIDRAALQAADRLKVIARYGAGVDRVDLDAAKEMGVIVTNTPGALFTLFSTTDWRSAETLIRTTRMTERQK